MRINKKKFKEIIGFYIVWEFCLFTFSFFAVFLLGGLLNPQNINFWQSLSSWDSGHFLGIAQRGYVAEEQYAFFPLFPILIKIGSFFTFNNYLVSALILSNIFLLWSLYFLYKLMSYDFNEKIVRKGILYLLIFPTSFFLAMVYTESLFILLVVSSFYFARQKRWALAFFISIFAASAKPFGLIMPLILGWEYLSQIEFKLKKINTNFLWIIFSPLGIVIYMLFLKSKTGNYFSFISSQANWQRELNLGFPITLVNNYLSVFSFESLGTRLFAQQTVEFFSVAFFVALLIYSWKKLRSSYVIYCVLLALSAISTGVLTSFPRFLLLAFPLFFPLAVLAKNSLFDRFIQLSFILFLGLFFALFLNGIWIA